MSNRPVTSALAIILSFVGPATASGAVGHRHLPSWTKQQAERAVLGAAARHGADPALADRGSGLLRDNVQASCRGRGAKASRGRYRRFTCALQAWPARGHRRLLVVYRPGRPGGSRFCCLRRGAGAVSSAPFSARQPSIAGAAVPGRALQGSSGAWGRRPSAMTYEWQRCGASGTGCAPIPGATRPAYVAAAADLGSTLRIAVLASNRSGTTIATSLPTAAVAAPVVSAVPVASAPGHAAAPAPAPAVAKPWFVGDFETGDLSQWPYLGDAHGVSVVAGLPGAPSRYAARAVTTNAPDSSTGGDASYVQMNSFGYPWENEGADAWFRMQVLLPSGHDVGYPGVFTPNPTSSGWNMLMEWHVAPGAGPASSYVGVWNDGNGSARLLLRLTGGDPHRASWQWIKDPVPLRYDHWYDIAVRMRWSPDPAVGYVEWWVDGASKFAGSFPTLFRRPDGSGSGVLFDVGHYRGTEPWIDTVYFDGVRIGPTSASVSG